MFETKNISRCKRRMAFTLAEVLITLGIIGIVAAMTLPTLIQSYKKREVETKLLKFYNVINNAIALSEINNGNKAEWLKPEELSDSEVTALGAKNKLDAFYTKYITPYLKITKKEVSSSGVLTLYFPDGTKMRAGNYRDIAFYINGGSRCESQRAKCQFEFNFSPEGGTYFRNAKNKGIEPYNFNLGNLNDAETNCKKESEILPGQVSGYSYCTMWIKLNGWKIPDDYPVKF